MLPLSKALSDEEDQIRREEADVIRFLMNLKSLIRTTNCVFMIQVDEDLISRYLFNNLFFMSDLVLKITSFKDNIEMKIGDYDGTIRILK